MLIHIIFKLGSYCVKVKVILKTRKLNLDGDYHWIFWLDHQAFDLMCLHVDFSLNTVWWIELLIDAVAI